MRLERELLGRAFALAAIAGVACVAVSAVVGGGGTAASAAVGAALVVGFLAVGQVPVAAAARGHAGMGAMLLLLGYVSRVMVLLVALLVVLNSEGLERVPLGLTVMVTAAAWTVGAVWTMVRWKPMLIDPEPPALESSSAPDRRDGASADR